MKNSSKFYPFGKKRKKLRLSKITDLPTRKFAVDKCIKYERNWQPDISNTDPIITV